MSRNFSRSAADKVLSQKFYLEKEWASRHSSLSKLGLGGDYEWISAVQKKFVGGGHASAVDVDAAVCIAEQKDQVDDVLELLYKTRHSLKASEVAESSEYAIIRLLLKYNPEKIFTIANDAINYGIFLDEHSASIVIDHFIKENNIQGAARIVSWVMQQEDYDNELLNVLCLYVCAKWCELPENEQTMPLLESIDEEVNEEEIRTFKFPYLKNECFDEHFDLNNAHHLVGKSLLWISRASKSINDELKNNLQLLGAVFFEKLVTNYMYLETSLRLAAMVIKKLTPKEEDAHLSQTAQAVIDKLKSNTVVANSNLSTIILEHLEKIRVSEEALLCEKQTKKFESWNLRRHELVKAQAEKVVLKMRKDEIIEEIRKLSQMDEQIGFFKNRLKWEKRAAENEQIERESRQRNSTMLSS
ncbi:unnamed protein product [Caenorhabditis bovis]|uniref:Uncharacterized protein n=1 Tax=Caenorhabditis bovis TaxID=2654633 RepID=A0A8S1FEB6_9PELO|nr:unnamed protein product [Caenorhabditis bovis]